MFRQLQAWPQADDQGCAAAGDCDGAAAAAIAESFLVSSTVVPRRAGDPHPPFHPLSPSPASAPRRGRDDPVLPPSRPTLHLLRVCSHPAHGSARERLASRSHWQAARDLIRPVLPAAPPCSRFPSCPINPPFLVQSKRVSPPRR